LGDGLILGLAAVLGACASAPSTSPAGDASYRSVSKDGMRHYPLALGEVSTGAVPLDHPVPIYPSDLLAARLPPQEVEALLMVDANGRVSEVRMADEAQADPQRRLFMAAVRTAAMQWTFEPLRVAQWASDANGDTHDVGSEVRPFSLDYVFRFAWKDGKPVTETNPH
jgi:hypothetical protein